RSEAFRGVEDKSFGIAEILIVPGLTQRLALRDVSTSTARRIGIPVAVAFSLVTLMWLVGSTAPPVPGAGGALTTLVGLSAGCGMLVGLWVWAELALARVFPSRSRLRFIGAYSLCGLLVGAILSVLVPFIGLSSTTPPILRMLMLMVLMPWMAVLIGFNVDGRRRVSRARQVLIDRASGVFLKGTARYSLLEDLRVTLQNEVQSELEPAFRLIDDRLAYEERFAREHLDNAAATILRDLSESTVRPFSHLLNQRAEGHTFSRGPWGFIAGVARYQPFRPITITLIFLFAVALPRFSEQGPSEAIVSAISGSALIFTILGLGNALLARFNRHHTAIFLGFFFLLQVPTFTFDLVRGREFTLLYVVGMFLQILTSGCVVWLTSGFGSARIQQGELLRLYSSELDAARIDLLVQTEVISSITKDAARVLHGSVQATLVSCAMAIDRAAMTNDAAAYAEALGHARRVLRGPWEASRDSVVLVSLDAEIQKKVRLWQGLASITAFVSPGAKLLNGALTRTVGEVVEEGICNAVRHGHPDHIAVQVDLVNEEQSSYVRIRVVDDGLGCTDGASGLGTVLLNEACPGRWTRTTPSGGGCELDAYVKILPDPLDHEDP
ncbi:MAG: hypothetical protein ACOYLU_14830, partial [Limisphaerales bacterium]